LKPDSEYYFWSGDGDPASRADTFRDRMKKICLDAKIRVIQKTGHKKSGGIAKKETETFEFSTAVPHMWRHTLVRDLYIQDIPVRRIADILGDSPEIVTKYYSSFDNLRRLQATSTLDGLHAVDPIVRRHSLSLRVNLPWSEALAGS
jgi:hypothetical protein